MNPIHLPSPLKCHLFGESFYSLPFSACVSLSLSPLGPSALALGLYLPIALRMFYYRLSLSSPYLSFLAEKKNDLLDTIFSYSSAMLISLTSPRVSVSLQIRMILNKYEVELERAGLETSMLLPIFFFFLENAMEDSISP